MISEGEIIKYRWRQEGGVYLFHAGHLGVVNGKGSVLVKKKDMEEKTVRKEISSI